MVRWVAMAGYAVLAFWQYRYGTPWASKGIPLEREQLIGWFLLGSMLWSLGRSRKEIVLAVLGWGALAMSFIAYDYTRGAIDGWWGHLVLIPGTASRVPVQAVHNAQRIITAEKALFFGHLPTEWLQAHLYQSGAWGPRWEVVPALTYTSHFVTVYVIAFYLWMRDKHRWATWVRTLVTLILLGLVGYMLYPTAPPWMASMFHLIGTVQRPGTRALNHIHLSFADHLWNKGNATVNLVAAMPSLHFAFTMLTARFFWPTARRWQRVLLVAYPCTMMFTLAFGGEHYIFDCLVGGALALLAVWVNQRLETWSAERRLPVTVEADPATPEGELDPVDHSSV